MAEMNGFDANQVEPTNFDPLPAGDYIAAIVESERKATKNNDGSYLAFTFEILEGEHKGRKLWDRLNDVNPNAKAVAIAKGQLSAICRAVNVMVPRDTQELHRIPMKIGVKCSKRKDSGEMENQIKSYKPRNAASTTDARPQQTNAGPAPWKR